MKVRFLAVLLLFLLVMTSFSFAQERRLASWYLLEGMKNYDQGLYISSIVNLKSALHLNSNLALAYKYLGEAYSKMYLWEQAAREYNKLLFFNPPKVERGKILKEIDEWEAKKAYLTARARYSYYILKYRDKVWKEPANFLNYLALAEISECERDYGKAEGFYRFLADEYPEKEIFKIHLAEALSLDGKFNEAESIYREAQKTGPLNVESVVGLNLILKKRYAERLKDDPDSISARVGLARSLKGLKRYERAIEEYKEVLQADYLNADVRVEMALCYELIGMHKEAVDEYRLLHSLNPKAVQHLFRAATLYEKVGNIKEAREAYERILVIDPGNPIAEKGLARLKLNYRFDIDIFSAEEKGRAGLKASKGVGAGATFYVPFDLSSRVIAGYSGYGFDAGTLSGINAFSYVLGIERDLPANYNGYLKYVPMQYATANKGSGNLALGLSRKFIDGGYFEVSFFNGDLLDNQNTFNADLRADNLRVRTFNPFGRLGVDFDGYYINYSDNNSGIDVSVVCHYVLIDYPGKLSLVSDVRYYNTAVTAGKVYWTPEDYNELRAGLSWKFSFDAKNYYLVDYRVGKDSDAVGSNDLEFEICHELDSRFKMRIKGDFYYSPVFSSEIYTYMLSLII